MKKKKAVCNIDNYQLMQRRRHNDINRKATFIISAVIMKQCKELNLPWVYLTILCPSLPLHCNTFSLLSTEFSICMLSILGQSLSATTLLLMSVQISNAPTQPNPEYL